MITRKKLSLLAVCAVAGGLLTASPAFADNSGTIPSGCSISPSNPTISTLTLSTGAKQRQIAFGGSATCSKASSAEFRLVHNYSGVPDARVKTVTQKKTGSDFDYTGVTCDNGGTTAYYSEIKLTVSGSPQRISDVKTLTNHC